MSWNFNIDEAPKGVSREVPRGKGTIIEHIPDLIIAAGNDNVVTVSKWLPKEERWEMFTKDVPPLAWQLWPSHPFPRE